MVKHGLKSNGIVISLQKHHIKEETIERMRLDEEVLMDFFREYISVSVSFHFRIMILYQCFFGDL